MVILKDGFIWPINAKKKENDDSYYISHRSFQEKYVYLNFFMHVYAFNYFDFCHLRLIAVSGCIVFCCKREPCVDVLSCVHFRLYLFGKENNYGTRLYWFRIRSYSHNWRIIWVHKSRLVFALHLSNYYFIARWVGVFL